MSDENDVTSEVAPYTPDTVMVRLAYLVATKDDDPEWTRKRARAEFDRWLKGEKAKAVADAQTQQAQIATQEPAGATQSGSGDSWASGGLDEAPVDPLDVSELLSQVARLEQERDRLENEVHGLEQAKDQWRDSANVAEAQVEAIRAAITREAAHGEAITRCSLVAERFQTALDSVSAP